MMGIRFLRHGVLMICIGDRSGLIGKMIVFQESVLDACPYTCTLSEGIELIDY